MRINLTKKQIINSIYMQLGFSKKICENLVLAYVKNFGVNASIVRLSNVFGKYSLHKRFVIYPKTMIGSTHWL